MAEKKELTRESFTVRRYGTGWTVNGTHYYRGDEKNENFEEVYEDRMKLIEGLARYVGLETEWRPAGYMGGFTRDTFCILKQKAEKVA